MTSLRSIILRAGLAGFILAAPHAAFAQGAADVSLRINRLEEQVRQLTGRNEEYQFQIRQLQEQMNKLQGDLDFRLQELEGGKGGARRPSAPPQRQGAAPQAAPSNMGAPAGSRPGMGAADPSRPAPGPQNLGELPSGPTAGPVTGSPGPLAQEPGAPMVIAPDFQGPGNGGPPPGAGGMRPGPSLATPQPQRQTTMTATGSAEEEYALGQGFLQRRDYEFAETQFQNFLRQFPQDARAPDALYGLGESYYQRGQHSDAIEPFLKVVTDYGQSPRAADSMLRLGQTLGAINQKEQACATLLELGRKYPRSGAKTQSEREMQKLGC